MTGNDDHAGHPRGRGALGRTEPVDVVVVDYGGVLTNPLAETFAAFCERTGLPAESLIDAFVAATERYGVTPMAALEVGRITERQLVDRLLAELPPDAASALDGRSFGDLWFRGRTPNQPFLDFLHELRGAGHRLALLTNNVREWERRWQAQVPVDALFETVVNSAHEGLRKPDPRIYRILCDRLGTTPERCLFVDDTEENVDTARALGMRTVTFVETGTAIRQIRRLLDVAGTGALATSGGAA